MIQGSSTHQWKHKPNQNPLPYTGQSTMLPYKRRPKKPATKPSTISLIHNRMRILTEKSAFPIFLSSLGNPELEPRRQASKIEKGVWISDVLASLKCEFYTTTTIILKVAGKDFHFQNKTSTEINVGNTSFSTMTRIAAKQAMNTPSEIEADLVLTNQHGYLKMFWNPKAQHFTPRLKYNFKVELISCAQPPAIRVIPLSTTKNEVLEKMLDEGLYRRTMQQKMSPWASSVLFSDAKDSELWPFFDYQHLNSVAVKKRYPLF